MKNDIFKEERNVCDLNKIPKSFFLVEPNRGDYTFDETYPFHYHDWYELYHLVEGSCTYRIGNKKYALSAGDWAFIPPNTAHKVTYKMGPHERQLICFSRDYISSQLIPKINIFITNPVYTPMPEEAAVVENIAGRVFSEFQKQDEFSPRMYKNLLFELLVHFIRKSSFIREENEIDMVVAYVIDYINLHYAENITLEELADFNNVSPSYLSRKFKYISGMNLSEYVRDVRLKHAKIMLVETNDSISQISDRCGFNDSNYFSYVFKKEEKISPLQY
ncbi:MAG: helix-turn-helix transcriptional regulator, partial [Clostridia bacterium]|nr:helix-turn-helix transcriptional regulator [Clostridia bacterium]